MSRLAKVMTLKTICFNGMTVTHLDSGATLTGLKIVVNRRRRQGYDVARISAYEYEVNDDENITVDDNMGWLKLVPEQTRNRV